MTSAWHYIRDFFRMGRADFQAVEALSGVLVRDLKSRLVIEFGLAILFASVGEYVMAAVWIIAIVPAEFSEILLHESIKRSKQTKVQHLYGQFAVSLLGGGTWCAIGVWQWLTFHPILMAAGLSMIVGVLMHVTFKYSDWRKCAVVGAIPPVLALTVMAILLPSEDIHLGHRALLIFGFAGLIQYSFTIVRANILRQNRLKKALSQASAANEAKSAFLANMSHEIRTPMNGVLGMADLLGRTELDKRQEEMVGIIQSSGHSLVRIIDDVLDISKIEAGHLTLTSDVFSLRELVHTIAATSELAARENNLGFSCRFDSSDSLHLLGDPMRIRQVIGNLVSNAIKFTEEGEVTLDLCTLETDAPDLRKLVVTVCDTGVGLSSEAQAKIFRPFLQADNSMSRQYGGTGLGLSIAREIAQAMGGDLTVESEPGRGSCFTFSCPLQIADAEDVKAPGPNDVRRQTEDDQKKMSLKILVAEDHAVNRRLLEMMLDNLSFNAVFVEDGLSAVQQSRSDEFDLILMDIQMPGLNGIDALDTIRRAERISGRPRTPIVALTANAMKHQVEAYKQAGFDGFLAKPFTLEDLVTTMSDALSNRNEID